MKKYQHVVFLENDSAEEVLEILNELGQEAAMNFLKTWDYGEGEIENEEPWGTADELFIKDGYIMSYNTGLPSFGLCSVVDEDEDEEKEKTISVTWHWDDLRDINPDLTDKQCAAIMKLIKDNYDASVGINWEVLGDWIDYYFDNEDDEEKE